MIDGASSVLITGGCGFVGLKFLGWLRDQKDIHLRIRENLLVGNCAATVEDIFTR